jgi:hypothetical protein
MSHCLLLLLLLELWREGCGSQFRCCRRSFRHYLRWGWSPWEWCRLSVYDAIFLVPNLMLVLLGRLLWVTAGRHVWWVQQTRGRLYRRVDAVRKRHRHMV